MKNYTEEKFLELLGKPDFSDFVTYICLNKAYQDFIFKLSEVIELFCPNRKLRLKTSSKIRIDIETIWAICKRYKLLKNNKKSGLEPDKDHFRSAKVALQKAISKKKKSYFQEKIEKNANDFIEVWKTLKSWGIKSGSLNQSKIALKKDRAPQFKSKKNANKLKISTLV